MELSFYQKAEQPDSEGRLMIHGRVCWESQKVRFSTGEKVLPVYFDSDKETVKSKLKNSADINQTLNTFKTQLSSFFYQNQNDPTAPIITKAFVQAEINRIRTQLLGKKGKPAFSVVIADEPTQPPLHEFWQHYVNDRKHGRSPEWARSIKAVAGHLKTFRPMLTWSGLKINTLNQFKSYLQEEENHSDNTIHSYMALLAGLIEYAERTGITVPRDYAWVETKPGKVIRPVLDDEDERLIINAKLVPQASAVTSGLDYLESVRWYFILACHTGLRQVDQWQYLNPTISIIENTPCLMALQQKTGNRVAIPLSDEAYYMLKHPVTKDKPPIGRTYNDTLRNIALQAGLTRLVQVGSFYKGELLVDVIPLHEAMSSHIARRTFATRMTAGGLNAFLLQELMGHESISSTQKYASISSASLVQQTIAVWNKRKER